MVLILPYIVIIALLATHSDAKHAPPDGEYSKDLPNSASVGALFDDDPDLPYTVALLIRCAQAPRGVESPPLELESSNYVYTISASERRQYRDFFARAARKCPGLLIDGDLKRFFYNPKEDTVETKVKGKLVTLDKSPL